MRVSPPRRPTWTLPQVLIGRRRSMQVTSWRIADPVFGLYGLSVGVHSVTEIPSKRSTDPAWDPPGSLIVSVAGRGHGRRRLACRAARPAGPITPVGRRAADSGDRARRVAPIPCHGGHDPRGRHLRRTGARCAQRESGRGLRTFQGHSHAAAPVGALASRQWPRSTWTSVRDADKPGLRCIQDIAPTPTSARPTAEDCSISAVWTPQATRHTVRTRPVMVWIHGGGFLNGSSDISQRAMAGHRGDIVVVSISYRLRRSFLAPATATGMPSNTDWPTSGPRCAGFATTSPRSAVTRPGVTIAGSRPARYRCVTAGGTGRWDCSAAIMQSGPCQAQTNLLAAGTNQHRPRGPERCADIRTAARFAELPRKRLITRTALRPHRRQCPDRTGHGASRLPAAPADRARPRRDRHAFPVLIGNTADEFTLFVAMRYLGPERRCPTAPAGRYLSGPRAPAHRCRYPLDQWTTAAPLAYAAAVTDGVFLPHRRLHSHRPGAPVKARCTPTVQRPHPAPVLNRADVAVQGRRARTLELRYLFDIGGRPALTAAQLTFGRSDDRLLGPVRRDRRTGRCRSAAWPAPGSPNGRNVSRCRPARPVLTEGFRQTAQVRLLISPGIAGDLSAATRWSRGRQPVISGGVQVRFDAQLRPADVGMALTQWLAVATTPGLREQSCATNLRLQPPRQRDQHIQVAGDLHLRRSPPGPSVRGVQLGLTSSAPSPRPGRRDRLPSGNRRAATVPGPIRRDQIVSAARGRDLPGWTRSRGFGVRSPTGRSPCGRTP